MNRLLWILFIPFAVQSQANEFDLKEYLSSQSSYAKSIIEDTTFRVQIIYTEVVPKDSIAVELIRHRFTSGNYFYPASTVKLPVAILTLEKLERLNLSLDDYVVINNDFDCGNTSYIHQSKSKNLSFRQLIEEMIAVSDNDYYNILYQFVTPLEMNNRFHEMALNDSHIYKSFSGCNGPNQASTNSLVVKNEQGVELYHQDVCFYDTSLVNACYHNDMQKRLGEKHEFQNKIVSGPYDFNNNLEVSLNDLNEMMLRLLYPQNFNSSLQWKINSEHQKFLIQACSKYPSELKNVKYKHKESYPDALYKYVYKSLKSTVSGNERVVSKIGLSHGFITEVAHVLNREEQVVFQIAVSIYANKNRTVNDGKYEYEEIARPFIAEVSRVLKKYSMEKSKAENLLFQDLYSIVFTIE